MKLVTKDIDFAREKLTLTNQRILYWATQNALILSDLHIGKTAHFRQHGIAVPDAILDKDLSRLKQLIRSFNPKKIIVVGDLFHANYNSNIDVFKKWLQEFSSIEKWLVRGNHDRFKESFYEALDFKCLNLLKINNLTFVHDTKSLKEDTYYISGHTHPGIIISLTAKQKLKLPCFHVNKQQIVLPAFSLFTGLNTNSHLKKGRSFAFTDDTILECNLEI